MRYLCFGWKNNFNFWWRIDEVMILFIKFFEHLVCDIVSVIVRSDAEVAMSHMCDYTAKLCNNLNKEWDHLGKKKYSIISIYFYHKHHYWTTNVETRYKTPCKACCTAMYHVVKGESAPPTTAVGNVTQPCPLYLHSCDNNDFSISYL